MEIWKAGLLAVGLMVGIFAVAVGGSKPHAPAADDDTPFAVEDTLRNYLATGQNVKSDDVLVKIGHLFWRDTYHLDLALKRSGIDADAEAERRLRDKPHLRKKLRIDPILTAEQAFPTNYHPSVASKFFVGPSSPCENCIDARTLSEIERLRLRGLQRIHTMAGLVLYITRCGHPAFNELRLIENQFRELPSDIQESALARETKAIEDWKDYHDQGRVYHGGWRGFCRVVNTEIRRGSSGRFASIFQTAIENRR